MHGRDSAETTDEVQKNMLREFLKFQPSLFLQKIGIYVVPPTGVRHTGPCMTLHLKINKAK